MRTLLFTLLLLPLLCFAHGSKVSVLSVYDGDTMRIDAALYLVGSEFNPIKLKPTTLVRLNGIDTPEFGWRAKCEIEKSKGLKAKQWLIEQVKGKNITIDNVKLGKYAGRVLANVYANGVDLSQAALDAGHARPYFGKKRSNWCL